MEKIRYFILWFFLISLSTIGNTQNQTITLEQGFFGQQYYADGDRMSPREVKDLLADFPEQQKEYTTGLRQRNIGGTLGMLGNIGLLSSLAFNDNGRGWDGYNGTQRGLVYGGFGLVLIGAIMGQPGENKVVWSYKDYAIQQKLINSFTPEAEEIYAVVNFSLHDFGRRRLKRKEHRDVLKSSPLALKQFNSGERLATIGLVSAGASLAGLVTLAATSDSRDDWSDFGTGKKVAIIGSLTGLLGGGVIAIVAQNKRKKSFYTFNQDCNCLVQTASPEPQDKGQWSIGPTNNGVGFAYTF